jgi:ATP-binding cassette subfamily F protein 3
MLELKNVTLRRGAKFLLEDASVRIETGYRTGLIGRNGAGKTSLFQLITGNLHEDLGSFYYENPPALWESSEKNIKTLFLIIKSTRRNL